MLGTCVEKGSELPKGHKGRKLKGRYANQGTQVVDEYQEAALFNGLGSSPATLEGAKAVDAYGCLPKHEIQQADASAAYTQAFMVDTSPGCTPAPGDRSCPVKTTTWVRLPPEARPMTFSGKQRASRPYVQGVVWSP